MDQSSSTPDSPFVDPDEIQDEQQHNQQQQQRGHIEARIFSRESLPPVDEAQRSSAVPHAPKLRPIVPGISSTVSSLSGSRGVSGTGGMAQSTPSINRRNEKRYAVTEQASSLVLSPLAHNHTLMQMLNLVGNRFLEAEANGMLPLHEEDQQEPRKERQTDEEDAKSPSLVDTDRCAVQIKKRGVLGSLIDEEATPRGGRSPLASSMANVEPATRTLANERWSCQTGQLSTCNDSPFGSQGLPASQQIEEEQEVGEGEEQAKQSNTSSTKSSQSDISASGLQVSIHALSTAPDSASERRKELTDRVKSIFALEKEEEIASCHPCWLFRGVLLQGYLYVLTSHICFYAYLPSREDRILRAGPLRKRTRRTHRFSRHWAVLRGRALSWYENDRDPYFPQDHIDLRNVLDVEMAEEDRFTVETPYRAFLFEADSRDGAQEWVSVLKRSVFRAQNEGESVRISIPLEAIVDVDGSDATSFSAEWAGEGQDMISIKVVNAAQSQTDFSMDEYFFLNLANQSHFVEDLKNRLVEYARMQAPSRPKPIVRDSTSSLHKRPDDINVTVAAGLESQLAEAASLSPSVAPKNIVEPLSTSVKTIKSESSSNIHSYPPSPSKAASFSSLHAERKMVLPQWVKEASSSLGSSENWAAFASKLQGRKIKESWSTSPLEAQTADREGEKKGENLTDSNSSLFSVLETPEKEGEMLEADAIQHFRECFSLPDSENLLGHVSVSLYRVLPVTGRLYVSTNYICFRSSRLASRAMGRTLMILPKCEVISVSKNNAFRYGHLGLVVVVRGHEELFLEFATKQGRDQCVALMELQGKINSREEIEEGRHEALLLTDLGQHLHASESHHSSQRDSTPPSLFNSASSTFLAVKPKENMHITFLTIGSRGDVQPYIAFAKRLKQEGHRVRIATHKEFQAWIESYDIEFKEVGGDPAELMRICVENGTFTMAFLRESMTKFRGWLDDLLVSCWNACQGTDVIVESPSAIAGIHVAEALQVPYYRSFTMPWTRTRVYPHAFAVPGHKAGGNYNYMSYVIFDQVFWRASAGQINNWRRSCLGLKSTSLDKLEQHKVPFLYNFSPNLVPKPIDWYDWIHVTGFWFLDHADETGATGWQPPEELTNFILQAKQNKRKLVYIGWGSIVVSDAAAMTHTVMEAVKKSGVCAILSKGWSDRLHAEDQSIEFHHPDVYTVQSIPHDWLFPQLDAACHHGGSGTLGASLRAGVPTIVKPYFGDQFFWASQVESLNIGAFVRDFSIDSFAEALRRCTSDVRMVENARKIGEVIRAEDGVGNAIRAFYGDWEYACSRIPKDKRIQKSVEEQVSLHTNTKTDDDNDDDDDDDDDGLDGWSVVSDEETKRV